MGIGLSLALLLLAVLLSAFFVGSEAAYLASRRARLQHLATQGKPGAKRAAHLAQELPRLVASLVVANNLAQNGAVAVATLLFVSFLGNERGAVAATLVVTVLLVVFAEVAPKVLAARHAEGLAILVSWPLLVLSHLLYPVAWALGWLASALGGKPGGKALASEEEIRMLVSVGQEEGTLEKPEAEMVERVFTFGDRMVKEVMIPRPEIIGVAQGTSLRDFLALYQEQPHNHYPVYEESMDNILGVLRIRDVLLALAEGSLRPEDPVTRLLRPAYFVPEAKPMGQLFAELRGTEHRLAIAVDEFGGVAGVVTLRELMAEVLGSVGTEAPEYLAIDERTVEVEGGMSLEEANQELGLSLPEGDYQTVAGFVLSALGHIPSPGEQFAQGNLQIVVTEMRGRKIEKVRIIRSSHATPASDI